jgi:hypothetical protein|tara:strand:+ start:835 stop:1413 length:579 start_codon:yes stop_codon:yes gene_type:complete
MLNNKIEVFDLPVPKEINTEIINYLGDKGKWGVVLEPTIESGGQFSEVVAGKKKDAGMYQITYSRNNSNSKTIPDQYLNNFGDWIYSFCKERTELKIQYLERMYWNLYHPGASCKWHVDHDLNGYSGFYGSIVYNLHTNDGGTEFEGDQKILAKERQAVVFPSHLRHRGLPPIKNKWRISLNLVVRTENYAK